MKGLNLYYIFNNRRFSYPAAFSQSTNQRRNAGSFIAGFSVSTHNLNFDYTKLPEIIQETMNPGMKVKHIKYTNISLKRRLCLQLGVRPQLPRMPVVQSGGRLQDITHREDRRAGSGRLVQEFQYRLHSACRCGIQQQQIFRGYFIRRTDIRLLQKQFLPKQRVRHPPNICRIQLLSEKGTPEK